MPQKDLLQYYAQQGTKLYEKRGQELFEVRTKPAASGGVHVTSAMASFLGKGQQTDHSQKAEEEEEEEEEEFIDPAQQKKRQKRGR
jgi:hypothetical protein